ncbi:hypothetical protein [Bacillus sp. FJAT-45037]|uniref:hypothetical protein n=1 Tax=Bacillus sp. FJAT-45037 TaxID=2011007 RepID=UPI000C23E6F8|nr:hypothetical protein [Bacillus sp. FJAT-45037]
MKYIADEPKLLWTLLFILAVTYASVLEGLPQYAAYGAILISLLAITTRYHLIVADDTLTMTIKVVGMTIRTKHLKASELSDFQQIVAGTKTIFILTGNGGQKMKLHRFKPITFEEALEEFAERNGLMVNKTVTKPRKES